MSAYFDALCEAMEMLAAHPRSVFLGQAVSCDGTAMRRTLLNVVPAKLLEMPVAEDLQMGMAIGMSLAGDLPICCYPRINFLLLAVNQLVLHLDKLPLYGNGWAPKVIVRTSIATKVPLDPGPQHLGDFTVPLRLMLKTVKVVKLPTADRIMPAYKAAIARDESTVLIEMAERY